MDHLDSEDALKEEENRLWLGLKTSSVAPALQCAARAIEAAGGQSQYMTYQHQQAQNQSSQQPQAQLILGHQATSNSRAWEVTSNIGSVRGNMY
jgi:hypothetical protein